MNLKQPHYVSNWNAATHKTLGACALRSFSRLTRQAPLLLLSLLLLSGGTLMAQKGFGTNKPNPQTVVHMKGVDQGLLIPNVSLTSATAFLGGVSATADHVSMLVYNTNTATANGLSGAGYYYWSGTTWVRLTTTAAAGGGGINLWDTDTDTGVQVEETNDDDIIRFDTVGTERMQINNRGNVGIGTAADAVTRLDVRSFMDSNIGGFTLMHGHGAQGLTFGYEGIAKTGSNGNSNLTLDAKGTGSILLNSKTTGNVGIGSTNAPYKLTVTGDAQVTDAFRDSDGDAGTAGQILTSMGTKTNWVSTLLPTAISGSDVTSSDNSITGVAQGAALAAMDLQVNEAALNIPPGSIQSAHVTSTDGSITGVAQNAALAAMDLQVNEAALNIPTTSIAAGSDGQVLTTTGTTVGWAPGMPTGVIMPYVGTTAPAGWLLCNGAAIPVNATTAALRALVGTSTPNLAGRFLRGAGGKGPALRTTQDQAIQSHNHPLGASATTDTDGAHIHTSSIGTLPLTATIGAPLLTTPLDDSNNQPINVNTSTAGNHSHNLSGSTENSGGNDTRPDNYGVNYIIKL